MTIHRACPADAVAAPGERLDARRGTALGADAPRGTVSGGTRLSEVRGGEDPLPVSPSSGAADDVAPFAVSCDRNDSSLVHMPAPRAALRHAVPVIAEGLIAPVALFYVTLVFAGFRGALIAALAWSYTATARRLLRGERVSTVLALDVLLLSVRTAVSFATGSSFLYFAQPLIGTVIIALVLIVSGIIRRPFTQRFADDFCPLDAALLSQPRVQQFFIRISFMWGSVLLVNTGLVAWLLVSSSLRTFVLERTAITWTLTAGAIFCSIYGFIATMRRDGGTVQWGNRAIPAPVRAS